MYLSVSWFETFTNKTKNTFEEKKETFTNKTKTTFKKLIEEESSEVIVCDVSPHHLHEFVI